VACVLAHAAALHGWMGAQSLQPSSVVAAPTVSMRLIAAPEPAANPMAEVAAAEVAVPRLARAAPIRSVPPQQGQALATAAAQVHHLPTDILDVRPMPRSAPDERRVEDVHRSGLPIRVRLYVEADGSVSSADVLSMVPGDEEAAQSVAAMFRDTAFIPGRLGGRDVASYLDIEIVLEPTLPAVIPVAHF
jgi:hypothetical protein